MKTMLVALLMRLYPRAWRNEYGAELADMLRARPLTARVCTDVVISASIQRMRATLASTWVGIGLMFAVIAAITSNVAVAPAYQQSMLPEHIELLQKPMRSEVYVLVLLALGFWTALTGSRSPGRAAMHASIFASIPVALTGLLMLTGVLHYVEVLPGQASTTFQDRGILYTFYKGIQQIPGPAPLPLLLSPLLRLPGAWLWGTIGGSLGRKYANWRRPINI
jgi:hypothetical protein